MIINVLLCDFMIITVESVILVLWLYVHHRVTFLLCDLMVINVFVTVWLHAVFVLVWLQGFFPPGQMATIGVDFMIKTVEIDGDKVKVAFQSTL